MLKCFNVFFAAVILIISVVMAGYATTIYAHESQMHDFSIEVDESAGNIKNIRYLYGELGWRERAASSPGGAFITIGYVGVVPDEFEVSWDTESNEHYDFKISVRSKLTTSINGKTVRFVIMKDHVEGYVQTRLPNYHTKRDRFY